MSRASRVRKASQRAREGGGREIALASPATSQGVMGPQGEWFGPGRPMVPVAPASVRGRRMDYMFGANYNPTPRQGQAISFETLRLMADRHDLTRLAIETRKDQMSRLQFTFGVIDSDDDLTPEQDARARRYKMLLRRPDGRLFWVDWLKSVLEDLLVIDAPTVWIRRTMDETEVVGLCQIDGATIKPIIDQGGRTPEPPDAAYQQILHGMPAANYTTDQLVYRPRNTRVHTVYGFSPVEQIVATINIAIRRQMWQHAYFTNGNIPDSLIGVPSTWTPDQIRDFQDWFDSVLTGNTERRRGAMFVPGEVAKSYVPTKDAEMFGAGEEWLARVVCFAFGISHQSLVKEVNRATADTAADQALSDGLAPIMGWVKSLMDGILIDQFQEEELEFRWVDDKELDPKVQDEIWKGRVDAGMADRNEWRAAVGEQPRPEPEASMLTIAQGSVTPLSVADQIEQQRTRTDSGVFPDPTAVVTDENPDDPKNKKPKSSDGVVASEGKDGAGSKDDKSEKSASSTRRTSARSLRAFRAIRPDRPAVERRRLRLQKALQGGLARVGGRVVAAVEAELERLSAGVSKADEPENGPTTSGITPVEGGAVVYAEHADQIIRVATGAMGSFDFLIDPTAEVLEAIAEDTTLATAAIIGPGMGEDIVDQVSERAVANARARAAELVGRRILADGSIIDNPDARWAITQSTRDMIHDTIVRVLAENEGSDAIIQELQDAHAFSPARAEMVSRTEVASVNSQSSMDAMHAAEDAGVELQKEWVLGAEPCDECQANADQGPIPLDQDFDSGDDAAPAHPNCVCATVPVVGDD